MACEPYRKIDLPIDPIVQHLVDTYPRLFHGSPPRSYSDVPDGWKGLVDGLCMKINAMLDDEQAKRFAVLQIKEKLGTLRFYISFGSDSVEIRTESGSRVTSEPRFDSYGDQHAEVVRSIRTVVDEAITRSETICAECGQPGARPVSGGPNPASCVDPSSVR